MRQTDDIPGEIAQARSCARRACIQALLAAAAQALAGNTAQATARAAHVRGRGPLLSSVDFFRGYFQS